MTGKIEIQIKGGNQQAGPAWGIGCFVTVGQEKLSHD
jgi:hypothetical protein